MNKISFSIAMILGLPLKATLSLAAGTDGKFCTTVVSYYGTATVDFWGTPFNAGKNSLIAVLASSARR